jgi:DNA-binding transcriptional MerR regulator
MNRFREKIFSIGEAARMSGVSIKQIRHWEDKGYIPTSDRVVCGERSYRKYGNDDLELIQAIKAYLEEGYTLPMAAKLAAEKISSKGGRQR